MKESDLNQLTQQSLFNNESITVMHHSLQGASTKEDYTKTILTNAMHDIYVCDNQRCTPKPLESEPNFENAVTELKSVEAASKEMHENGVWILKRISIFSGEKKECHETKYHYNNCCRDTGWGQDIHLAGCNAEEKELGRLKAIPVCHTVGHYCDKQVAGVCQQTKKSYCCFHSQLAYLVMEGAHEQLKLSWGDAKEPHCQGLTPKQLQRVDFDKLDLSAYFEDLHPNQQTQQHLKDKLKHAKGAL
jgi:conjugal transfer mating pair stabilization protein TraN